MAFNTSGWYAFAPSARVVVAHLALSRRLLDGLLASVARLADRWLPVPSQSRPDRDSEELDPDDLDRRFGTPEQRFDYARLPFRIWLDLPVAHERVDARQVVLLRDLYRLGAALASRDRFVRVPAMPDRTPLVCRKILRYALDPRTATGAMPGRLFACLAYFEHSRVPVDVVLEALRQLMLQDHDVSRAVVAVVYYLGWQHDQ